MTAFDEAMRERAARILAELEYVQSRHFVIDTLRHMSEQIPFSAWLLQMPCAL